MSKISKNREKFYDILSYMDAWEDFANMVGEMCASINLKYGCHEQLPIEDGESILLQDIISKYNETQNKHYIDSYIGTIKSQKKRDRAGYLRQFKQLLYKAINCRYSCGRAISTLEYQEVIDTIDYFFSLLDI